MKLTADSGSTKTLWSDGQGNLFRTQGCNPRFLDEAQMAKLLQDELLPQLPEGPESVEAISFYGAGCATEADCAKVGRVLSGIFAKAVINVDSDMVGAARLLCGASPGVACILGTGSNAVRWDGLQVVSALPSLGFVMGDEGSGAELGKRLLKAYFYRELPTVLRADFEAQFPGLDRARTLEALYAQPLPNRWCAGFAPFFTQHRGDDWVETQLRAEMGAFVTRRVLPLVDPSDLIVHATGGVAWHFRTVWTELLLANNLCCGQISEHPLAL